MTPELNAAYWTSRYRAGQTGWDMGQVSPPIKAYFDQYKNDHANILIPGAGNSHEAEYLYQSGFKQVHVCDWSLEPLQNLQTRCPDFPEDQLIHKNFFNISGSFDIIVEQTFFCALQPDLRPQYAIKVNQLLRDGGKLVGLLFNRSFDKPGPPFGGEKDEYLTYFQPYFDIKVLDSCYNSAGPRQGNELFMILIKK